MPQFFDRYILQVEDVPLMEALIQHSFDLDSRERGLLEKLGDKRYAPDKWTVKDILQHIIDTERIQAYRALRFSRNDQTVLPGFDEELYGQNAKAAARSVEDLLEEMQAVRESTIRLFKSFNREMLLKEGICFKIPISVLALGFVIAGHSIHHFKVIREKYYPLK